MMDMHRTFCPFSPLCLTFVVALRGCRVCDGQYRCWPIGEMSHQAQVTLEAHTVNQKLSRSERRSCFSFPFIDCLSVLLSVSSRLSLGDS